MPGLIEIVAAWISVSFEELGNGNKESARIFEWDVQVPSVRRLARGAAGVG